MGGMEPVDPNPTPPEDQCGHIDHNGPGGHDWRCTLRRGHTPANAHGFVKVEDDQ